MVPLPHPRDDAAVCLYTDATADFWGSVVTQVPVKDLSKKIADQNHDPLAFFSGRFVGASSRWPIVEKEALLLWNHASVSSTFCCDQMDFVFTQITEIICTCLIQRLLIQTWRSIKLIICNAGRWCSVCFGTPSSTSREMIMCGEIYCPNGASWNLFPAKLPVLILWHSP